MKRDAAWLWQRVDRSAGPDGCWPWTRARYRFGHGHLRINGRDVRAHRLVWEITYGPTPEGLHVCHHCDNPPCCNPGHLFLGTNADNIADKTTKNRALAWRQPRAKLTPEQVHAIRAEFAAGEQSCSAVARRYGVSRSAIWQVVKGRTWRPDRAA